MTRLLLLGVIVICLSAVGLTGCDDDEGAPMQVCIPSGKNHPPQVIIENAYGEGVLRGEKVVLPITGRRDTVTAGAKVTFQWRGEDPDMCGSVQAYRFRMTGDEDYRWVGSDFTSVTYTDLPSGVISFRIAAIDNAWAMTSPEVVRTFVSNFSPDTWYEEEFIEKREVDGSVVDIVHYEGDTVAVGSEVVLEVHATDPDGDDSKLRYPCEQALTRTCRGIGGGIPTFTFFDAGGPGPSIDCTVKISSDPSRTGLHRVKARAADERGRRDSTPAEIYFYSNLPPVFGMADILVQNEPLSERDSFSSTGSLEVRVTSATDLDPGDKPVSLDTTCELEGLDVPYSAATEKRELGNKMQLIGIVQAGRYKLTVRVIDYGCRESAVEKEIEITLGE